MNDFPLTSPTILQHYVLVRKWSSDIEFFKIETYFLHRLLDEYFLRLCNSYLVKELKITGERLLALEKQQRRAARALRRQILETKWISKDLIQVNNDRITEAQVDIEYLMAQVTIEFKAIKKDVFKLVEKQRQRDRLLIPND